MGRRELFTLPGRPHSSGRVLRRSLWAQAHLRHRGLTIRGGLRTVRSCTEYRPAHHRTRHSGHWRSTAGSREPSAHQCFVREPAAWTSDWYLVGLHGYDFSHWYGVGRLVGCFCFLALGLFYQCACSSDGAQCALLARSRKSCSKSRSSRVGLVGSIPGDPWSRTKCVWLDRIREPWGGSSVGTH